MSDNVIKTAGRVFEILEYFRELRTPLAVRDVAEHFGYPTSSTAVLLKSVATLGYLAYDNELKAYFPTVRVALLGDWVWDAKFRHRALQTIVEDLAKLIGDTVILALHNDVYAEYLYIAQGTRTIQFYAPLGARRPLCMSGSGWALLSQMSDELIAHQVRRANGRSDPAHQAKLEYVMEQVNRARRNGYAFSRDVVTPGAGVIAMPIKLAEAPGRYAIAVAGVVAQLEEREAFIAETLSRAIASYDATVLQASVPAGT